MMKRFMGYITLALVFALPLIHPQTAFQSQSLPMGNGRIAFSSDVSGRPEIYTVNADGSDLQQLTHESGATPDWSPDGTRIAFVANRDGGPELYLMNADGSNQTKLINRPDTWEFSPVWSPDGTQIAFASQDPYSPTPKGDIYVINADGSDLRALTTQLSDSVNFSPSWSPDGSEILFLTDVNITPRSGALPAVYDLFVVGVDGNNPQLLYRGGDDIGSAEWSPSGEQVIYHELQPGLDLSIEIMLREPDALGPYILSNYEKQDIEPSWSPDGSLIVFSRFEEGRYVLYTMQPNGTGQTRVTDTAAGDERGADWQPIFSRER